ncbi:MAG: biotin synthase BioB [Sedimentisphaerales bacterium]|nr:biotin synthase BioB [Sedimentisphaerales bacterium]
MDSSQTITRLGQTVLAGGEIGRQDALFLLQAPPEHRLEMFVWANRIRRQRFGSRIHLCSIASARTAPCSEDCRFCAQSRHGSGGLVPHTAEPRQLLAAAEQARGWSVDAFGIVSSGRGPVDADITRLESVFREISSGGHLECCASLGCLTAGQAERLKDCGVKRYNHNLETSARFFPRIVTSHRYEDRLATVRAAHLADLEVCCGGILGMGESPADRVDLALTLRELDVDVVPLNLLNPIAGTPLGDIEPLAPLEALQAVAMFRFVLPDKPIKLAGGRERCLRDLQSWMFHAGASGMMVGNYLTTEGRPAEEDFRMLADLQLRPAGPDRP